MRVTCPSRSHTLLFFLSLFVLSSVPRAAFAAGIPNVPDVGAIDVGVAVGEKYLIVGDQNSFVAYDKATLTRVDVPDFARDSKIGNTSAATLFAKNWIGNSPDNVNLSLPIPSGKDIPQCDWRNPIAQDVAPPAGVMTSPDRNGKPKPWPSSSCLFRWKDARIHYDPVGKRFWIMADVRNQIWGSTCQSGPGDLCAKVNKMEWARSFVAVSKDEDPTKGFWTFPVNQEDGDFTAMSVHGDFAIFSHVSGGPVRIFDATAMANGQLRPIVPPKGPQPVLGSAPWPMTGDVELFTDPVGDVRFAKSSERGTTYLLHTKSGKLTVYTLTWEGAGASRHVVVTRGASMSDSKLAVLYEPHYASGNLYLITDGQEGSDHSSLGTSITVNRIPLHVARDGKTSLIESSGVRSWTFAPPAGSAYDFPTIDVTREGHVVVGYRAVAGPLDKATFSARYTVLQSGECEFRNSVTLAAGMGTRAIDKANNAGRIDFQSSALDPADPQTVWLALTYTSAKETNSVTLASVRINDRSVVQEADAAVSGQYLGMDKGGCNASEAIHDIEAVFRAGANPVQACQRATYKLNHTTFKWTCGRNAPNTSQCPAGSSLVRINRENGHGVTFDCFGQPDVSVQDANAAVSGQYLGMVGGGCNPDEAVHDVQGTLKAGANPIRAGQAATYVLHHTAFQWTCGNNPPHMDQCPAGSNLVRITRGYEHGFKLDCFGQPPKTNVPPVPVPDPSIAAANAAVSGQYTGMVSGGCDASETVHDIQGTFKAGANPIRAGQAATYVLHHTAFQWTCGNNTPHTDQCPAGSNLVRITRGSGHAFKLDCFRN